MKSLSQLFYFYIIRVIVLFTEVLPLDSEHHCNKDQSNEKILQVIQLLSFQVHSNS